MRTLLSSSCLCAAVLTLGCSSETETQELGEDTNTQTQESEESGESGEPVPSPFQEVYDQGLDDYLGTIEPDTITEESDATHYHFAVADGPSCLRGDPWHVSDRPGSGSSGDLLLYLQGGGACWSDLCYATELALADVPERGMLNRELAGNPFADLDVVFFPYCDGSVFAGDSEIDDDDDGEIDRHHRGLVNLSAGLDVAKDLYPNPPRVILAGSSAGSYGVHFANMLVRAQWPEAEIFVIADAGLGLGRPGEPEFLDKVLGEWKVLKYFPPSCPACADTHLTGLIDWQLEQDPNMRFAALSAYQDAIIGGFFLGLGGPAYEELLKDEIAALAELRPERYDRFLFPGTLHTVTSTDSSATEPISSALDTTEVDGVSAMQWLGMWLAGDPEFDDLL